jgi:hypothetical protein
MNQKDKILYLLNYNVSKTTFENTNNFILEQKKWYQNPGFEKYAPTDYEKRELEKSESQLSYFANKYHSAIDIMSLVSSFLGPWGRLVSLGLEATNAYLYHKEGKDIEAGLRIAFSMIPAKSLIWESVPAVKKYGIKFFENILLKSTKSGVITKTEREALDELMKSSKYIANAATKELYKKALIQVFKNYRLVDIIKFLWLLTKKYPKLKFALDFSFVFFGIPYTWYKIANYYGITNKNTEDKTKTKKFEIEFEKDKKYIIEGIAENVADTVSTNLTQKQFEDYYNSEFSKIDTSLN